MTLLYNTINFQQHSPGLRRLVLFSLNDYLGLSCHPDVCRAAAEAAQQVGLGLEHPGRGVVRRGRGLIWWQRHM